MELILLLAVIIIFMILLADNYIKGRTDFRLMPKKITAISNKSQMKKKTKKTIKKEKYQKNNGLILYVLLLQPLLLF